jgi:hypothetical protein
MKHCCSTRTICELEREIPAKETAPAAKATAGLHICPIRPPQPDAEDYRTGAKDLTLPRFAAGLKTASVIGLFHPPPEPGNVEAAAQLSGAAPSSDIPSLPMLYGRFAIVKQPVEAGSENLVQRGHPELIFVTDVETISQRGPGKSPGPDPGVQHGATFRTRAGQTKHGRCGHDAR